MPMDWSSSVKESEHCCMKQLLQARALQDPALLPLESGWCSAADTRALRAGTALFK